MENCDFLIANLRKAKLIITCRTGEFTDHLDDTKVFELAPLNPGQIETLARNWLKADSDVSQFLIALRKSPYAGTTIKPLLLAHLAAICERLGDIPDKPKTVYRKIITLLLEDWDQQQSLRRPTRFSSFAPDRKFEFLCVLAYELTLQTKKSVFGSNELLTAYRRHARKFGLPDSQGPAVIAEVESHTGLLVQSGFEQFEFFHKSIQEYLTAEYLVRLPTIPGTAVLGELGTEVAVAIAISSDATHYLWEILNVITNDVTLSMRFYNSLLSRMAAERPDFDIEDDRCVTAMLRIFALRVNRGQPLEEKEGDRILYGSELEDFQRIIEATTQAKILEVIHKYYNVGTVVIGMDQIIRDNQRGGEVFWVLSGRNKTIPGIGVTPTILAPRFLFEV